jgi:hypothetical protein
MEMVIGGVFVLLILPYLRDFYDVIRPKKFVVEVPRSDFWSKA